MNCADRLRLPKTDDRPRSVAMPRPQFSIRSMLWLTVIVAGLCFAWANMGPLPAMMRLLVEICILLGIGEVAYMARVSRLKKEGKVRSGWAIIKEWWTAE